MKHKAVIISCFNYYDNRLKYIKQELEEKGYDVTYITSDFDHISKEKLLQSNSENVKIIRVPQYTKNLSFKRIYSHYTFSKGVYHYLKSCSPDLVYGIVPPNFLSHFILKYKKINKNSKIILDLYDLWPETFPVNKNKKIVNFLLKPWGLVRDLSIKKSDFIVTECDLYRDVLKLNEKKIPTDTLYLTKKETTDEGSNIKIKIKEIKHSDKMKILYLGSINNIIDIEKIVKVLNTIKCVRNVELHIIGDGEKKQKLLQTLDNNNIYYVDHGRVFSFDKKFEIANNCKFAINIMKPTVKVGLTMKSIEYFQFGLPLLNNIKADTYEIVEKYNVGYNVTDNFNKLEKILNLTDQEHLLMRERSRIVYEKLFSEKSFQEKVKKIFLKY